MRPRRAEAPSVPFTLRLSPEEKERLKQAARANNGQLPSDFARDAILTASEDVLEDDTHQAN